MQVTLFMQIYLRYTHYIGQNTNCFYGDLLSESHLPLTIYHNAGLIQLCMCEYSLAKAYCEMLNHLITS